MQDSKMCFAWRSFMRSVIGACIAALSLMACVGRVPGDGGDTIVVVGTYRMVYGEASAYCQAEGGALADVRDVGVQAVYDAWAESLVPSEGVWVATTIVNTEGTEYGYAMTRGGALLPVEMMGTRTALPACEVVP